MQKGRYLNPKYARRERLRRQVFIILVSVLLTATCVTAIVRIDTEIRQTMLPAAPPVVQLEQEGWQQYRLELLGSSYSFSTEWLSSLGWQLDRLLRTPPAPLRLLYQINAYLTDTLPPNVRGNPRHMSGV